MIYDFAGGPRETSVVLFLEEQQGIRLGFMFSKFTHSKLPPPFASKEKKEGEKTLDNSKQFCQGMKIFRVMKKNPLIMEKPRNSFYLLLLQ